MCDVGLQRCEKLDGKIRIRLYFVFFSVSLHMYEHHMTEVTRFIV